MTPGSVPPPPIPILIGVLYDFPQGDGGATFEEALRLGLAEAGARDGSTGPSNSSPPRPRSAGGTAHEIETAFGELVESGVLAVVGPSISDNGLIVGPLADAAGVPTINSTGGEKSRGEYMFHYQVGSLQEEPVVLVEYLARHGIRSVAAAYDNSPVGRGYAESLAEACATAGIDITGSAAVSLWPRTSPRRPEAPGRRAREPRLSRSRRRRPGRRLGGRGRELVRPGGGQLVAHVRLHPPATGGPVGRDGSTSTGSPTRTGAGPVGRPCAEDGPGAGGGGRLRHRPAPR